MSTTNEEKFISIEYETWKRKYLPLEGQVRKLEMELAKEKENKTITLKIGTLPIYGWRGSHYTSTDIAYIRPTSSNPDILELKAVKEAIMYVSGQLCIGNGVFISEEQAEYAQRSVNANINSLEVLKNTIIRERILNKDIISKIPKFIKWLFKIKE